jgi:hypothetical protein
MGNCLAAWINTLPSEHRHHACLKQIVDVYGALDNFESILADLITCPPGSRAAALGVARPYLLSDLKEAICDHFGAIRSTPATLYGEFAHLLRPGDSVITFNYDLGVERALRTAGLWDVETGYGFPIGDGEQPSPVEVLKLHGSTNWRALLFGGMAGFFAGSGNSLGYRPVLLFQPDLEYLGYRDFVDPLCSRLDTAASLPAMIMPALPKHFHFATTYGEEWKYFWDGLWLRAERAIENADELTVIGYSLPTADERARAMLLGTGNKAVRLLICCGKATAGIEQEFRDHGFSGIEAVAPTFDGYLARATWGDATDAGPPILHKAPCNCPVETLSRLNALIGKQGLLSFRFVGEVGFTFLSVDPSPDLPKEADDEAIQTAINRSRFLVRFEEGTLIDGSDTKIISGRDIVLIRGGY